MQRSVVVVWLSTVVLGCQPESVPVPSGTGGHVVVEPAGQGAPMVDVAGQGGAGQGGEGAGGDGPQAPAVCGPTELEDGNPCTVDACTPTGGVTHTPLPNGSSCSDDSACTTVDTCNAGKCRGGAPVVCVASDECHLAGVCDPGTGACSDPVAADGTACDDGLTCSSGDVCEGGECLGGDEIPCQVAVCDELTGGIVHVPLAAGAACSLDACTSGTCSAAGECIVTDTTVTDDGDPCTVDFCDPELGPSHTACSDIDPTVATTVLGAYGFLFDGAHPIQTGVLSGTIEERRAVLLSGSVTNREGQPLPSVRVSIHGHPEFGETLSQANGRYLMVANGGGTLQIELRKLGYLVSSRSVESRWNQTHEIEPAVLISSDPVVTELTLDPAGTEYQVAQGSISADGDGQRQGTLLVPPGVQAVMRHADGSLELLAQMHVRLTEFTVGETGPDAMPATLPAMTGYTYAFEVGTDEAVAAGAPAIEFSEPVPFYLDNFLGLPVGTKVPLGSYEREQGVWIPADNGVVVGIVGLADGLAALDVDGDAIQDSGAALSAHGITDGERAQLASLYPPGATLWRVRLPHFTDPWDANLPVGFPAGSGGPGGGGPGGGGGPDPNCETQGHSTIECEAQVLRESIGVAGSPFSLVYTSARVPGRTANRALSIPLTDAAPPTPLKRVDLEVTVAGRRIEQSFGPNPLQTTEFVWDGLDAFGRPTQGVQNATVTVRYAYDGVYGQSSRFNEPSLGHFPAGTSVDLARDEVYASQSWTVPIGSWLAKDTGLAGWSLDVHHAYDPASKQLMLGNGRRVSAAVLAPLVVDPVFGSTFTHGIRSIATAPDGTIYACQDDIRIVAIAPDNQVTTIAGGATLGYTGDGGPAQAATLHCRTPEGITGIAVGPDGSLYFLQSGGGAIRRIGPEGLIETVAGSGTPGYSGDGGPATQAAIMANGLAVTPGGDLLLAGGTRIRQVDAQGIIQTIAGNEYDTTFIAPFLEAPRSSNIAPYAITVDPKSGVIYFVSKFQGGVDVVYSLGPDGMLRHVAGCVLPLAECSSSYTTGVAVSPRAALISLGMGVHVSPDGQLLLPAVVSAFDGIAGARLFTLDEDGLLRSPFGVRDSGPKYGPGVPANQTNLAPGALSFFPNGDFALLESETFGTRLSRLVSPYPATFGQELAIASVDGQEVYIFDGSGRHLRTLHGLTSSVVYAFQYDPRGFLIAVEDAFGQATIIERDADGAPTAIVAPHGQRTELTVGPDDYLASVSRPGDQDYAITYEEGGLMATFELPTFDVTQMTWDEQGRIVMDEDSGGAGLSFALQGDPTRDWSVNQTTELGQVTTYAAEKRVDDTWRRVVEFPDGTQSTREVGIDSSSISTLADGTETTVTNQSDPRWGIATPVTSTTTELPSGLTKTINRTRSVTLADPAIPSTLVTQTDVSTVSGHSFQTKYTAATRSYDHLTPLNRLSQEFLDTFGRAIETRAPGSPNIRTVYTEDQVTAIVIDPDATEGNGNERVTEMSYDGAGRLVSVTDPLTHTTAFTDFDAADRPETIVLPDASEVQMTYDVMGNLASVTPPGQASHDMTYGLNGRIESYTPPVGNTVSYHYDLDRHVELIDFGMGGTGQPAQVDFLWDSPTGQLQTITSPSGTIEVGYTFGELTSLVAASLSGPITTNVAYDGPLPVSLNWSGPVSGQVNWTYNDRFLMATEAIGALPTTSVTYAYDDDGLVTQAGPLTITRDAASGRVTQKTVGNVRESYGYSTFGELSRQTVQRMSGSTVVETLYDVIYDDAGANGSRDTLGRITKKTEWMVEGDAPTSGARPLTSRTYDYGYNPNGRPWLESVAVGGNVVSAYTYDENGNRTSAELAFGQLGYSTVFDASLAEADTDYNEADQLLAYGAREYTWNAFGQLESMRDTAMQQESVYEYDLYGNLLTAALPDGRSVEYDVDGAGRRVGRHLLDAQGMELQYRGWIYRDLLRPIAEVDASGTVVARYVYQDGEGPKQNGMHQLATRLGANQDTSLPFAGSNVPEFIDLLDAAGALTQRLRLIINQVGTVQAAVDVATGDIVQRLEHDEFGRVLFDSNPGLQPFGFAGGLVDVDTGLVRFGARDYEPATGRWTARDPVRFEGAMNAYGYASADPLNRRDLAGLDDIACMWALLGAAGAVTISGVAIIWTVTTTGGLGTVAIGGILGGLGVATAIGGAALVCGPFPPPPPPMPDVGGDGGACGGGPVGSGGGSEGASGEGQ